MTSNNKKYYDNKKLFADLRRTMEEIEQLERDATSVTRISARAWDENHTEYMQRRRVEAREALLFEHVPKRRCPVCQELKLKSKQWVVLKRPFTAVIEGKSVTVVVLCLACWQQLFRRRGPKRKKKRTKQ